MATDFGNNPYSDKLSGDTVNGVYTFSYTFEDGSKFTLCNDGEMRYNGYTFKLNLIFRARFVKIVNEIVTNGGRQRPTQNRNQNRQSSSYKETPKTGNPLRDKYNLLNDKIKLREEQLDKMSKNDPSRLGLKNELEAYKRVRDKMKIENKFEGLKYLRKFEAKKWTLDELFEAMNHPFLSKRFVEEIFSDVIDEGYSLGFKGQYSHDWVFPDGYNTISNVEDIHQRYKLKGFTLAFYKDLDMESGNFRKISEIKDELTGFENSVIQYLNQSEFDDDYEFMGIRIEMDKDPQARNLQKVELEFVNKSAKQTPYSNIQD